VCRPASSLSGRWSTDGKKEMDRWFFDGANETGCLLDESFAHGDLTRPKFGSPRCARLVDGQVDTNGVTLEPVFFYAYDLWTVRNGRTKDM
jgi:hypothetical protein